ncbi:IS630 family transposase [Streptomyces sp. NPDC058308]|uniref:IS630 family transposase n=1 Tax=Streptomyces sp. NPDC058308 TaxID=3346440 RepID=UPI0036E329E3
MSLLVSDLGGLLRGVVGLRCAGGMGDSRLEPLVLSGAEWLVLENWARRRTTAQGLAKRARIVLACARGWNNTVVAARCGTDRATVRRWRTRFLLDRLEGLSDEPRPGVPRSITDAQVEEVVVRTLEEVPEGGTHWSKRELARQVGISPTSVHRIWRAFCLQAWRTEEFKISPDPLLTDKIRDVVGLYLAPPAHAVLFSLDRTRKTDGLKWAQLPTGAREAQDKTSRALWWRLPPSSTS